MKKIKSFLMIMILMLCISGCSKAPQNASIKPKQTIIWGIVKYNPYIKNINPNSEIIKFLENKFNCKFEFKYYDTVNIKILTDLLKKTDAPDILTMESISSESMYLAANNLLVPASELISREDNLIPDSAWDVLVCSDNSLYGIPGRFATDSQLTDGFIQKFEGIYIAQPFYNLLGKPEIKTPEDILRLARKFKNEYPNLTKALKLKGFSQPEPIILEADGRGIQTLKHIFKINPIEKTDNGISLSILSDNWAKLLPWLYNLNSISKDSMSFTGDVLNSKMNGSNLFYIGSVNCINSFNSLDNEIKYVPLSGPDVESTLNANPYGNCQTYVFKSCSDFEKIRSVISYLLSDEGNSLVKYGIKDKHWIKSGDDVILLDWVKEQLEKSYDKFADKTGIGTLLYLTSFENDNPYTSDVLYSSKDVFSSSILNFDADSTNAIKLKRISDYEIDICQKIICRSLENKDFQATKKLDTFREFYNTNSISSLKDKYEYWSVRIDKKYIP